ncbi:43781_t:CDS:2 [Gigaspora margarita]|uniref:43781_t:CDS:1 n=1 Tax=Gigaspora margarita TaxID=4874 RepID=A0ABN7VMR8_GIGMA|nr:43781_t:CDS:2 [Gigaspora margarita]
MPTCSTCTGILSSNAFIFKGKNYDTCNHCRTSRAEKRNTKKNKLLNDSDLEQMFIEIISIQEISNYIANAIDDLNDYAELSLTFCVRLDEDTIKDIDRNVRIIAKLIIDKIEEDLESNNCAKPLSPHSSVGNAYFMCFQSFKLEHEFKNSIHEKIFHYNCNGKISIKIDILVAKAKVVLKHKLLYERPVNVTTPSEIKQEISKNLDLNPIELHKISSMYVFNQQQENEYELCYQLETDNTTAIVNTTESQYFIDLEHWICSYPSFFQSHFLLCKHLIHKASEKSGTQGSQNISKNIEAFRMYNKVNMLNQNLTNENEEDITKRWQKIESKLVAIQHLVVHINEELNANNFQHIEAIINNLDGAFTIISDIEKAKNQRVRYIIWHGSKP